MKSAEERIKELPTIRVKGIDFVGKELMLEILKEATDLLINNMYRNGELTKEDIQYYLGKFRDKCECDMCGGLMVIDPDCPIHGKEKS